MAPLIWRRQSGLRGNYQPSLVSFAYPSSSFLLWSGTLLDLWLPCASIYSTSMANVLLLKGCLNGMVNFANKVTSRNSATGEMIEPLWTLYSLHKS